VIVSLLGLHVAALARLQADKVGGLRVRVDEVVTHSELAGKDEKEEKKKKERKKRK
jgi:hypothetical protein